MGFENKSGIVEKALLSSTSSSSYASFSTSTSAKELNSFHSEILFDQQDRNSNKQLVMFLQKAMRYYRIWIYTCNAAMFVSVLLFVSTAIWVFSDPRMTLIPGIKLYHPSFLYCYVALFIQGGILQAVGCLGAMRLQERLLNLYWNILLVVLFGDVIVGIVWIFKFDKICDSLRSELRTKVQVSYPNDDHIRQLWDRVQVDNRCCGVGGPKDYVNMTSWSSKSNWNYDEDFLPLPDSCCINSTEKCFLGRNGTFHSDGCHGSIHRWFQKRADILFLLGYCVITFLKLCFLGILKYEIKEMIQKINVLNGRQDETTQSSAGATCVHSPSLSRLSQAPRHQSSTSINTVKMSDMLPLHRSSPVINSAVHQQYNHVIPSISQLKALATRSPTNKVTLKTFNGNNNDVELMELHQKC